jgi:outer membrane protein assembly factor BamB
MTLSASARLQTRALLLICLTGAWPSGCGDDDGALKKADAGVDAGAKRSAVWAMMGNDPGNSYFQPDEDILNIDNAAEMTEQWRFKIDGFPAGSPVLAEGKVFVTATGGLYALDLKTGDKVWSNAEITGTASPAYADGALYVHTATGANLYKLNAADGAIVWGPIPTYPQQPRCDGTSSPIIAGDKVLVGHACGVPEVTGGDDQTAARGGVEAFALSDGAPRWTYWTVPEQGENGAMVWSTVSVDLEAKVVFAATGNNYSQVGSNSDAIHAIDLETGERLWRQQVRANDMWSLRSGISPTGMDTDFGANPVLATVDGRKLVADGDKGSSFWALDRETGDIVWSYEALSAQRNSTYGGVLNNGAFDGRFFYVAANEPPGESVLHVLNPADGSDVIEPQKLGAAVWGELSLANGLLFVPVNNVLRVYNAKTGEQLTSFDTGGTIAAGAAAIANGRVIVKSGLQYGYAQEALNNDQVICYGLGPGRAPVDAGAPAPPTGDPTFSAVYKEIIVGAGCAGSAICHGGDNGHLVMNDKAGAYAALVGIDAMGENLVPNMGRDCKSSGLKRVVKGEPDQSLLVKKLEGTQPCGLAMPFGMKLSDMQINQVRSWIQNGANDD